MFGRTQVVLDVAVTRASFPLADGAITIVVSALLLLLHCIALHYWLRPIEGGQ